MQALPTSQLLRVVEQAYHLARRAVARYSSKYSKRRYPLHQYTVLLCLKVRKNTTYRTLLDELIEMPRIRNAIGLTQILAPSTLCKVFNRLDMAVGRVLLDLYVSLLPTNGVVGIDVWLRPESRLETLHEASETDDPAVESHAVGRYKIERDPRSARDDDQKT